MFKIKNKFIIFVIALIVFIVTIGIYSLLGNKEDRSSYAILLKWNASLNSNLLKIDKKESLKIWDKLKTIWTSSLLIIEWWDWSVTRLWWNSTMQVKDLQIWDDLEQINIAFELLNWKTWSNVVSFLWEKSYFKQYFRDYEAASRWTVFNVDLSKDYINVTDHGVALTKTWEKTVYLSENKPFNIKKFSFIELQEFIKSYKDKAWESLNKRTDTKLVSNLKTRVQKDIDNIKKIGDINIWDNMSLEKKKEIYDKLLKEYQKLNFVKSTDKDLYDTKIELKSKLISLSSNKEKERLLESTLYDFKDIITSKDFSNIDKTMDLMFENKEYLKNIDINRFVDLDNISDKLKDIFNKNKQNFESIFWTDVLDKINWLWVDDLKDVKDKAEWLIHDWLDSLKDKLIDNK